MRAPPPLPGKRKLHFLRPSSFQKKSMSSNVNHNGTGSNVKNVADATPNGNEAPRKKPARKVKPKASANGATERVAALLAGGDLATEFSAEGASAGERRALEELTALARSLRRAVGRLQRAADSVEAVSTRVLEGGRVLAIAVSDEAASVDATVSSITEIGASSRSVSNSVSALAYLAQSTSTSALEMAASIDEVSTNADALTAFVEETATSIEEMAISVKGVAASTESLAKATDETERSMRAIDDSTQRVGHAVTETAVLAEEVQRSAEQGSAVVLETAASMRAMRGGIEEAGKTIAALGERSERIGAVTRVIDEIADRTNLLALNARILAAQAGQQGRGFAVVAEEIKELSERTARSTEEIEELIKDVRESVAEAATQSASNRQLADEGVNLAERAAASLKEISDKTNLSATAIRQIADAATVQALESHQVTEQTGHVRRRAQEIERATSEQARTAAEIGGRAVRMAELTGQVRRAMQEQTDASKHIAMAMEQLTEVVGQIAHAVGEQYRGAEEVLSAVEVIREAVTRNQASIVQINVAAGLLDYEAASLRETVSHFKLPAPRRGGHLHFGVYAKNPSLDVLEASTVSRTELSSLIFECLVGAGRGAEVEPHLAESWDTSADGRTYTFRLRAGVRFHNQRFMTADDVVYSVRRALRQSKTGAWVFMNLVGAELFARGGSEELPGARRIDERTVALELDEPLAFFLPMLCLPFAAVVPREEVEREGGASFIEHPIGTGPFRFVSNDKAAGRVELARADGYWDGDKPHVDSVSVEFNENGDQLFERMRGGELAFLREGSSRRIAQLARDPAWRSCVVLAQQLHTQMLVFDAEQPPFDDARVRRAFAHAIDRRRLVEEAYGDMALPATGPIPPGLIGHDPEYRGLAHDPDLARRLLYDAGHRAGLKLVYWRTFSEQSASARAGEIVCEQLAAIGVECEVRVADAADLINAALSGRASLAELSWYADYADPDNFTYVLFHSANRASAVGRTARVEEVVLLSALARTTVNHAESARLYTRLQHLIAEEALGAFLTHRRVAVIHRPDIEGLHAHLVSPIVRPQEIWIQNK
jgi:ABC-type transport system substrate-binding protein/methyl-accepting chemotaxis protein